MRRTPARAAAVLVASVLVVAGLAACSDDESPAGLPTLEDAEKGEQVDVDDFVDAIESSFVDGASAQVAFDVQGPTRLRGRGLVAYDADGMNVDIRITDWQVEGGWINLRTIGDAAYMRVPESRGLWVDIGADDAGLADSVMQEADPRSQIDLLRDAITEVRYNGDDVVAGVPARRYQVQTESTASATDGGAGAPDVTEFWFDESGRLLRRSNDLDAGGAQFTWVDWDAAGDIVPPPAARVITLEELERLRRQAG